MSKYIQKSKEMYVDTSTSGKQKGIGENLSKCWLTDENEDEWPRVT